MMHVSFMIRMLRDVEIGCADLHLYTDQNNNRLLAHRAEEPGGEK